MATKDIIKAGRERLGMTHQAFGDAVGVSRGAVQQWERGTTAPTRKHQPKVAALLVEGDSMVSQTGVHSFPPGTVLIVDPAMRVIGRVIEAKPPSVKL